MFSDLRETHPTDRSSDIRTDNRDSRIVRVARAGAGFIGSVAAGLASSIGDVFDRIVSGLRGLAPAILAVGLTGCQTAEIQPSAAATSAPTREVVVVAPDAAVPETSKLLGKFTITFYYVIGEDEVVAKKPALRVPTRQAANDNQASDDTLAAITTPELTTLYAKDGCEPIAEVSREFASQLALQGTGKLRDGRVVNIWGTCSCDHSPCFKVTENQWGTSGTNHPLQPFRTVAVDRKVVKLGTLLHVPLLEGRLMPGRAPWGGFIHDGCVIADDTGGGIDGNQLDLFVGRKGYFLGISGREGSHAWAKEVPVFDGSKICERKGRRIGRKAGSI